MLKFVLVTFIAYIIAVFRVSVSVKELVGLRLGLRLVLGYSAT